VRKQIGNAVPPRAALEITGALVNAFDLAGLDGRSARELSAARAASTRTAQIAKRSSEAA
jgi:hypothetical protein